MRHRQVSLEILKSQNGADFSVTLAIREQLEMPGFGPWSVKEGITHAQPPEALLEQLLPSFL